MHPGVPLRLSTSALTGVLNNENIGEPHITLTEQHPTWRPPDERNEFERQCRNEFTSQGLADRGGRLDETTREWLHALSRPRRAVSAWVQVDGELTTRLVVPVVGGSLVATRERDEIAIITAERGYLAETLVKHLPPAAYPRGAVISVDRRELTAGGVDAGPILRNRGGSGRGEQVRRYRRLMSAPVTGSGEVHVEVRHRSTGDPITRRALVYRDISRRRWLVKLAGNRVTVLPGDPGQFAELINEAAAALPPSNDRSATPDGL